MFSHNTWIAFYGGEMRLNDTSFGSDIMDFMGNAARCQQEKLLPTNDSIHFVRIIVEKVLHTNRCSM